jgi:hypothetical protein
MWLRKCWISYHFGCRRRSCREYWKREMVLRLDGWSLGTFSLEYEIGAQGKSEGGVGMIMRMVLVDL